MEMSESSGKYKLAVGSHNQMMRDSKQMLRDIHKSLRHLNVCGEPTSNPYDDVSEEFCLQQQIPHQQQLQQPQQPQQQPQQPQQQHHQQQWHQQQQQQQQQLLFEQQLAKDSNISALTQSVAGERRSYPRATKQFATEEIRKPIPWREENFPRGGGFANDIAKMEMNLLNERSWSYTDLSYVGADDVAPQKQQQPKHEVEASRDSEGMDDKIHCVSGIHKKVISNANIRMAPTQQRMFGEVPHITRSNSSLHAQHPPSNPQLKPSTRINGSAAIYCMKQSGEQENLSYQGSTNCTTTSTRHYPPTDRTQNIIMCEPPHIDQQSQDPHLAESNLSPVYGSLNSQQQSERHPSVDPPSLRKISSDLHRLQRRSHYEDVTLRQKTSDRTMPSQKRWSAEVYALPYDFSKPPPPYPGLVKGVHRVGTSSGVGSGTGSEMSEVQVSTNTPITIFDEKNDEMNAVDGIPERYERIPSYSSSGQSSPRHSQQIDPLPGTNDNSAPVGSQFSTPLHLHSPSSSRAQHIHLPTSQESFSSCSQLPSPRHDSNFVPIEESGVRRDRGSPPPYPGSRGMSSDRSSINMDELDFVGDGSDDLSQLYYSSDSGTSSKRASIATEPGSFTLSDSSVGESSTADGIERSYSPLPISSNSTCELSSFDSTANQPPTNPTQIQLKESGGGSGEKRLKNCNPQAYKFFMEQHVENLIKLQEQRKHRRTQLEAEMARVGLAEQAQEEMRKLLNKKESNYNRLRRAKMDISMFTKIITVGVGAFGEVNLVRKNGTNAYYAMKILRKSEVLRRNQVAHVKAERDILAEADVQWVVKLYYSFQNDVNLYFVMDYIPGGDLMALLIKKGIFPPKLAQFYTAELTLAIESVHKLGFIHRDIKPDNVLIDSNGHIKLTDFGLCTGFHWTHNSQYYQAKNDGEGHSRQFSMEPEGGWESLLNDIGCDCKQLKEQHDLYKPLKRRQLRRHTRCQAHSLVGTPNYIAPEVLMRIPYAQQCDWWSLGVILYEMLVGQPPFLAPTPAETQLKVINWTQTLTVPKNLLSKESRDLIKKLCTHADQRLGKGGADDVKRHPYFKGINFKEIHTQQPPYVPIIKHATDTSNFDPVPDHLSTDFDSPENAPVEVNKGMKDGPEYAFYEFTFRHFFDDGGIANPNFELSNQEKTKSSISHSKRPITSSNKSVAIPTKVSAPSSMPGSPGEKKPIYV